MITLKHITASDKDKLWNLLQKYLYEMSAYYDLCDSDMDNTGNYEYKYFDTYFTEKDRHALFIYDDVALVGFVMINTYSSLNNKIDHAIAEFTIFPKYRKKHLATQAAEQIFKIYKGKWELVFDEQNKVAKSFWLNATKNFSPATTPLNNSETILSFTTN